MRNELVEEGKQEVSEGTTTSFKGLRIDRRFIALVQWRNSRGEGLSRNNHRERMNIEWQWSYPVSDQLENITNVLAIFVALREKEARGCLNINIDCCTIVKRNDDTKVTQPPEFVPLTPMIRYKNGTQNDIYRQNDEIRQNVPYTFWGLRFVKDEVISSSNEKDEQQSVCENDHWYERTNTNTEWII